jgi:hypothetical protein
MVSIMSLLVNLVAEQKNLGWEHSNEIYENGFKNLGIGSYSIDGFQKWFLKNKVGMIIPELEEEEFDK